MSCPPSTPRPLHLAATARLFEKTATTFSISHFQKKTVKRCLFVFPPRKQANKQASEHGGGGREMIIAAVSAVSRKRRGSLLDGKGFQKKWRGSPLEQDEVEECKEQEPFEETPQVDDPHHVGNPLLLRLGAAIEKLAALNSSFSRPLGKNLHAFQDTDELLDFRSTYLPSFSFGSYVSRLVFYLDSWKNEEQARLNVHQQECAPTQLGIDALVLALVYVERIYKLHPNARLCSYTLHRLICTGMLLATKFSEDRPLSNRFWAKVAGISLVELNKLEQKLLELIQFQLYVLPEDFLAAKTRLFESV